ncbi:hypothetical protein EYC84_007267 [Monilinia fructicola]|uniref:Uncharacterized protein n=1 Tax=Monilinia fructicola TaxID=38448 RepID=A0A5M9KE97_MONFR|nr:hypothetical protein EYC84_007267 [Monilinia fructicola]
MIDKMGSSMQKPVGFEEKRSNPLISLSLSICPSIYLASTYLPSNYLSSTVIVIYIFFPSFLPSFSSLLFSSLYSQREIKRNSKLYLLTSCSTAVCESFNQSINPPYT